MHNWRNGSNVRSLDLWIVWMYVEGKLLGEAVNRLYISDILVETELGGMYGILVGTLLKPDG